MKLKVRGGTVVRLSTTAHPSFRQNVPPLVRITAICAVMSREASKDMMLRYFAWFNDELVINIFIY